MGRRTDVVVVAAMTLASCYRPAHEVACETFCSISDPRCPANMACGLDLRCHGAGEPDCSDAAVAVDTPDGSDCFGTGLTDFTPICDPAGFDAQLAVHGTIDTAASCNPHMQVDGTLVCVLIAGDITVDASTTVVGSRPLVLVAVHDLDVMAPIDVAGHVATLTGGAGHRACYTINGTEDVSGGGGGGGGGFQGVGGSGGAGDGSTSGPIASGSMGGAASQVPHALRGGCDGGMGGGTPNVPVNNQGLAGGGLYLIAGNHLQVDGVINAGGAGGAPAGPHQGGGGGGAGGMLVFEAPSVTITTAVAANGGSGSGGAGTTTASPGADGTPATSATGAAGGSGTTNGGSAAGGTGGRGSFTGTLGGTMGGNEVGSQSGCAGAGGGGGAGYILIFATTKDIAAATISPLPS